MNFFKKTPSPSPVKNMIANTIDSPENDRSFRVLPPIDRTAQFKNLQQNTIPQPAASMVQRITYDLIRQTIVSVRVNDLLGKGKWNKDDHLAEQLFCLVRNFEPDTKLTYERIMQAIVFVKTNDIMGAGKWSKEDHLAEYLYALVRLSGTDTNAMRQSESAEQFVLSSAETRAATPAPKKVRTPAPAPAPVPTTSIFSTTAEAAQPQA